MAMFYMKNYYGCKIYTYDQDVRYLIDKAIVEDIYEYAETLNVTHPEWDEFEARRESDDSGEMIDDDGEFVVRVVNMKSRNKE